MYFSTCILVSLMVTCYGDMDSEVAKKFMDSNLVPNILSVAPNYFISVNYSSVSINLGTRVNPLQTLAPPLVSFEADSAELYTFMFFGPDLPIDLLPRYTQFLHWLVVNIPGTDMEKGDTVCKHFPPTPYPGGFPYLFLLYKQKKRIDPETLKSLSFVLNRPGFDPVDFEIQNDLTGPISGNFMRESYLSLKGIKRVLKSLSSPALALL